MGTVIQYHRLTAVASDCADLYHYSTSRQQPATASGQQPEISSVVWSCCGCREVAAVRCQCRHCRACRAVSTAVRDYYLYDLSLSELNRLSVLLQYCTAVYSSNNSTSTVQYSSVPLHFQPCSCRLELPFSCCRMLSSPVSRLQRFLNSEFLPQVRSSVTAVETHNIFYFINISFDSHGTAVLFLFQFYSFSAQTLLQ